jgi:hypothetical protein
MRRGAVSGPPLSHLARDGYEPMGAGGLIRFVP